MTRTHQGIMVAAHLVTPIEVHRAKLLNRTKNRTLATCMLSNINILRSLRSACYYF